MLRHTIPIVRDVVKVLRIFCTKKMINYTPVKSVKQRISKEICPCSSTLTINTSGKRTYI